MLFKMKGKLAGIMSVCGCTILIICFTGACGGQSMVILEDMSEETELQITTEVQDEREADGEALADIEPVYLYVHVCGEVMAPGVYRLPEGSRVYEAVIMAGGFTENAEEGYVNQAAPVTDGSKVRIPSKGEAEDLPENPLTGPGTEEPKEALVDINSAPQEQLCTLPGIGSGKAAAIIQYREQHGGFQKKEDILKVDGIKEGTYNKLKDRITVR